MDEDTARKILAELRVISRALALLCAATVVPGDASLGVQARVLKSIGCENSEIAELLNTTADSVRARLSETKSWRGRAVKEED